MCGHDGGNVRQKRQRNVGVLYHERREPCQQYAQCVSCLLGVKLGYASLVETFKKQLLDGLVGVAALNISAVVACQNVKEIVLELAGKYPEHELKIKLLSVKPNGDCLGKTVLHVPDVVLTRCDEIRCHRLGQQLVILLLRHFRAGRGGAYADVFKIVDGIFSAVVWYGVKLLDHGSFELLIIRVAAGGVAVVCAVAREAPLVEENVGNKIVFVNNVVYVPENERIGIACGGAHGRLKAVAVQVVAHELGAAELVPAVKLCRNEICNACRAAVAGYPELDGTRDGVVGNVLLEIIKRLSACKREALVIACSAYDRVSAPLTAVEVAAYAERDKRVAGAVIDDALACGTYADGVHFGLFAEPLV